jgi:hypothetical protein
MGTYGGSIARKLITGVVVIALLVFFGPKLLDFIGDQMNGRSYKDTLGEVQNKFGDDAKVVGIQIDANGTGYAVLSPDGSQVLIRQYGHTSEELPDGGTGYSAKTSDASRRATAIDHHTAIVTLGQLDKHVVEDMWNRADFPHTGSTATLKGSTWEIGSGARPFDKYQARFDGSGFHQTQNREDVFGGDSSSTTSPAPARGPSQAQSKELSRAAKLGTCMRHAIGDPAKVQACARRYGSG